MPGPFPVDAHWNYWVFQHNSTGQYSLAGTLLSNQSSVQGVLGVPVEGWTTTPGNIAFPEDTQVDLFVNFVPNAGPAFDTGVLTTSWSPTASLNQVITLQSGSGGLTTSQEQQLTQVVTNTTALTPVTQALGNLFNIPPLDQWLSPASTIFLEGTGRIATGSIGPISTAIGMWIDSVDFPPELGHTQGFMLSFVDRIAQLVAIRASSDFPPELFLSIFDLHTEKALWLWNDIRVEHVGYSVLPGCAVHGRWVTAGLGPR